MLHICGVPETFGEWYQKTNKTEDTNTLTLLASKIIAILYNTRFGNVHKAAAAIQQRVTAVLPSISKETFADSFQKLYERCQPCVVKDGNYFEGQ
jgi:hypothetical protein